MNLRDYQKSASDAVISEWEDKNSTLVVMPTGTGKCLGKGTPVLMFDGTVKPVENITVGELLMGPDSRPRRVLSLAHGQEEMYRVTPVKGDPYTVNHSHILSLKITGVGWDSRSRTTQCGDQSFRMGGIANVSVADYVAASKTFKHVAKGWRTGVEFSPQPTPLELPPYILGAWLGDGSSKCPAFTGVDDEIMREVRAHAVDMGLHTRTEQFDGKCPTVHITSGVKTGRGTSRNVVKSALKRLGLILNKHVPHIYKSNSRSVRLEVLAGLMDTDGSLRDGGFDFISKREQLSDDVCFLARSVGLAAYKTRCNKTCGQNGVIGTYYRVCISGDVGMIPCRVRRKIAGPRRQKKNPLVTGISATAIGVGEYYGFEIDGDRLFMLGDFTVTHNTVLFADIIRRVQPNRVMVVAHREELLMQARDKISFWAGLECAVEIADQTAPTDVWFRKQVVVSTVQTQSSGRGDVKRMHRFKPEDFGCLIIDECHHATAQSYRDLIAHYRQNPNLKVLGVTATPDRTDEEALGQVFDSVAFDYEILDAIQDGYLVPIYQHIVGVESLDFSHVRTTAGDLNGADLAEVMENEKNMQGIAGAAVQIIGDRRTIVFAASVKQAETLSEIFNRHKPKCSGWVCGQTDREERKQLLKNFANGNVQIVVNVGVLTEGFDNPGVEVCVMARPTKSRSLYAQMCLDADTEILTDAGWRTISDTLAPGERAAAFQMDGSVAYEPILDVVRRFQLPTETFFAVDNPHLSIRVTNHHDLVVRRAFGRRHVRLGWEKLHAETACSISQLQIPVAGKQNATGVPLTDDELRFIGLVLTDGNVNPANGQLTIYQSERYPENLAYIERVIAGCGFKFGHRVETSPTNFGPRSPLHRWTISRGEPRGRDKDKRGWSALWCYLDKDWPGEFEALTREQLIVVLEALHVGDGTKRTTATWKPRTLSICTANMTFANSLQSLCVRRGIRCNLGVAGSKNSNMVMVNCSVNRDVWSLPTTARDGRPVISKSGGTNEPVWCITVPSGMIITRRHGKVAVVGNCGRSTRPLPGVIDAFDTPLERRAAIEHSAKPHCTIVDFVGNSGRHKLMTSADILGGNVSDEALERAVEKATQADGPVDMAALIQRSEEELKAEAARLKARRDADAARRAQLVAKVQYRSKVINPFDVWDIEPQTHTRGWDAGKQLTEKQGALLRKQGIDPDSMPYVQAKQVLNEMFSRWSKKLCTLKQAALLKKYGYKTNMTMKEASATIDALANNGWRRPEPVTPEVANANVA